MLQTGSWGKKCKLMTKDTFFFHANFTFFFLRARLATSWTRWRRRRRTWLLSTSWTRTMSNNSCCSQWHYCLACILVSAVDDLIHVSRHLNFAFTMYWSFQIQTKEIPEIHLKLPPKDENQIKTCMFLIATTMLHQLSGQYQCHSLAWYDITWLLARSFTTRSRLLINCRFTFMCYSS